VSLSWFALRVQSNREEQVRDALVRHLRAESKESLMPEVLVPTEPVTEIKGGKRKVTEKKLFPGYIFCQVETDEVGKIPDGIWFLIRETSGVGDFIGPHQKPWPIPEAEVLRIKGHEEKQKDERPRLDIQFAEGDRVRIKDGTLENREGVVEEVQHATGRVKVIVTLFSRAVPVDVEYWQLEKV